MYFEIYELDSAHFLSTPGLAALKNTEVKLDFLTDVLNGRKRYQMSNISCYSSIFKS